MIANVNISINANINIIRTVKSSRIRWTRNVACMSRREMHAAVLREVLK
jgi:hypothetical protein